MAGKRKRKVVKRRAPARRRVRRNPLPPRDMSSLAAQPSEVYSPSDVVFEFGSTYPDGTLRPEGYRNWYIVQVKTDAQMDYEYQQFSQGLCFARGIYKYRQQMHDGTSLMYCMHSPEGRSKLFWDVHIPALDCSSINIDNIAGNTHSADCPARRGTFHVSQIKGAGQRHPNMQEAFMCSQFMVEYLQIDPALCQNLQSGLAEIEEARRAEYQRLELERARAEGRLPNRQMPLDWQNGVQRELIFAASGYSAADLDSFRQVMSETVVKYTFAPNEGMPGRPQLVVVVRWDQGTEFEDKNGAFVLTFSKSGQRGSSKLTLLRIDDVGKAITMFYKSGDVPTAVRTDGEPEYRRLFFPPPSENWKEDLTAMVSDMLTPETRSLLGTPRRALRASYAIFTVPLVRRQVEVAWLPLLNRFQMSRVFNNVPYREMQMRTLEETARAVVEFLEVDTPFIFDSPMLPILRRIADAMEGDYGLAAYMQPQTEIPQLVLGVGSHELRLLWENDRYQIEYDLRQNDRTEVPTTDEAIQIVFRYLTTGRRWYPWIAAMDRAEAIIRQNINFGDFAELPSIKREESDARVILRLANNNSLLWVKVNDPDVAIITYALTTPKRREVPYAQLEQQLVQDVQDINSILQTAATTPLVEISVWSMLRNEHHAGLAFKRYINATHPNVRVDINYRGVLTVDRPYIEISSRSEGLNQELKWTMRKPDGDYVRELHAEEAAALVDELISARFSRTEPAPTPATAPAPTRAADLSKRNWKDKVKKALRELYGDKIYFAPARQRSDNKDPKETLYVHPANHKNEYGNDRNGYWHVCLNTELSVHGKFHVMGRNPQGRWDSFSTRNSNDAIDQFFSWVSAMMTAAGYPATVVFDEVERALQEVEQLRGAVSPWQNQFWNTWRELSGFSSWLSHYDVVPRSADAISIKIRTDDERMLLRNLDAYATLVDRASVVSVELLQSAHTNRYEIHTINHTTPQIEPTPEDAARWVFNHLSGVRSSAQIRQNDRALSQRLQAQAQTPSEVLRSTGVRPELVEAMREAELPPQEPWIVEFMDQWVRLLTANPWLELYTVEERPAISAANPHRFLRIYLLNEDEIELIIRDPYLENQPTGPNDELTVATVERGEQGLAFEVTLGTAPPSIMGSPATAALTILEFIRQATRRPRQNPRTPRRNPASIHAWLGIAEKPKKSKKLRRKSGKRKR